MNVFLVLVPAVIILLISGAQINLFGYKAEQAHFVTVCAITLFLTVCGIAGILEIGFYFIIAVSLFSLIYLMIAKFNLKKLFTPAISGYFIGLIAYIAMSKGSLLFDHDDVVHWAYATKVMYYGDTFYKGLQAMFTPTFNYFVTKASFHFSETTLFSGAWIIIWSCFILPLKDMAWKDWKKVLACMFAQYCVLGVLYGNVSLHIDQSMGYMAGAIMAYSAINNNKTFKDYIIIVLGLFAITQMKDSFGAVVSMLASLFIIVVEIIQNFKVLKKKMVIITGFFFIPILGYVVSLLTINKPAGYYPNDRLYRLHVIELILKSRLTLTLLAITALAAVVFIFYLIKNEKKMRIGNKDIKLYIVSAAIFLILGVAVSYKLSSLYFSTMTFAQRGALANAWEAFFVHTYSGLTIKYLLGLCGVLLVTSGIYLVKEDMKKMYLTYSLMAIAFVLIYAMVVLFAFSAGFCRSGQYTASVSWERYLSTGIVMLLTYITIYIFAAKDVFSNEKKRVILMGIVIAIVIRYLPHPGIIWDSKLEMTRYGPRDFMENYIEHSDLISSNLEKDDTLFIVTYESDLMKEDKQYGYYPLIYIKYNTAPILSNWMYKPYDFDGTNAKEHDAYIKQIGEYDYLYVQSAGKEFYEEFADLFPKEIYFTKALYKVEKHDGNITLNAIYNDEDYRIK